MTTIAQLVADPLALDPQSVALIRALSAGTSATVQSWHRRNVLAGPAISLLLTRDFGMHRITARVEFAISEITRQIPAPGEKIRTITRTIQEHGTLEEAMAVLKEHLAAQSSIARLKGIPR